MKSFRFCILCLAFLTFGSAIAVRAEEVRVWEGKLDLPTYLLGAEDPNPPFDLISHRRIYPYTMLDDLTDQRETKAYRALFLENEYLKAIVLPGMGGRLYSLYDKVSKREVFYHNNVVKYGLVALRGAWISGGVEFNFPDGHTTVTVSPVASRTLHGPDGSGTIVVGNVDLVTGMYWEVAMTLRPDEARLEERVTLYNATPRSSLYWYWQNTAVPATEDMQFIYPMREARPHVKGVVWSYPMHDGVDYSWYKNVREATSLFGRQVHRSFFGAYYHKSDYGVVHVADYREVPGKKIWTWGVADDGLIWTDLLTDADGPYNEIQAGRYETQLNYEFMPPRRVERFAEYWFPVAALGGGFLEATPELALNVRFLPGQGSGSSQVEVLVSPVVSISNPRLVLKLGSKVLKELARPSFSPLKTDKFEVPVSDIEEARQKLTVEIESADGQSLLRWAAADPVDGNRDFVAAAGSKAPPLKALHDMTVQELFLHGVSVEKDGKEEAAAEIYRRVLQRDPGFVPALLKQTWWLHRAGDFEGAERSIYRALARNPLDPDANYAAGVVYRSSHRWTLAEDAFWASIHFGGAEERALAQLGELAVREKKFDQAAELLRRALSLSPQDAMAKADLAVALRLAGRSEEAAKVINEAVTDSPLFPWGLAEQWRLSSGGEEGSTPGQAKKSWASSLAPGVETYLTVAAWYRSLDDLASSDVVLKAAIDEQPAGPISPMVYYYLASNARRQGRDEEAKQYAAAAAAAPFDKVFPHRLEDALVLDEARSANPLDAHAPYFLGNFLFAVGRYDDAARMWLQALGAGFEYSVLSRNLGVYAWRVKKDLEGAAGFFEKAIELAPEDYRLYVSLDEIYASMGDQARREKLMANAPASVAERDTVRVRRALLDLGQKQYGQALEVLGDHHFKPWEGGQVVRHVYVAANLEEGRDSLAAGKPREAEKAFRRALEYPVNLGVGKPDRPHDEEALYFLGEALEAAGDPESAKGVWGQAVASGGDSRGAGRVFAALAMRRIGRASEAEAILGELLQAASSKDADASSLYIGGLVERYRNRESEAQQLFQRASDASPEFWPAKIELGRVAH